MLEVREIEVVYGRDTKALHQTSLVFETGRFTVLLGPSGAGKSTLLRSLNGLVRPTAGKVLVETIGDIAKAGALRKHRRSTGMVFQQHHLIGRASALQNVLVGRLGFHSSWRTLLPPSRAEKLAALEALDRVELIGAANRRADQLSGGQQQRVGIARALVQKPTLVLADEPVASLDPATAERALQLFHDICRADGITAIVSLHQVELAMRFADRIVGLAGGRVVFDGPPAALDATTLEQIYGRRLADTADNSSSKTTGETTREPQTIAA